MTDDLGWLDKALAGPRQRANVISGPVPEPGPAPAERTPALALPGAPSY